MKPSPSPTMTCNVTAPIRVGTSRPVTGTCGDSLDATLSASAPAMITLTLEGIILLLNGGAMATHALGRTRASRKATRTPGGSVMVTGGGSTSQQARQGGEQLLREVHDLVQHPVAGHQDDEGDHGLLRHEGQRDLLDLGHGLEQRDAEPDGQAGDEDRRRHLGDDHHHLQGDLENRSISHLSMRAFGSRWTGASRLSSRRPWMAA